MDLLNELSIDLKQNSITTIAGTCNSGKSSVFEKIAFDYISRGYNCLYVGDYDLQYFFARLKRKMVIYNHRPNINDGKIVYKDFTKVPNELYLENIIKKKNIKVVFFDCHVYHKKYTLYNRPKDLLLEKIEVKKTNFYNYNNNQIDDERVFYMNLRILTHRYKTSFYINKNVNRNIPTNDFLNNSINNILMDGACNSHSILESDMVFGCHRDNPISTTLKVIKNRFGSDNKKIEVLL
jgi:hypothetical protein